MVNHTTPVPLQIRPPSVVDQLYAALRAAIIDTALHPGTRISKAEVALPDGTSRQPVRLIIQHRAVVEAIAAGTPATAEDAMRPHLQGIRTDLPGIKPEVSDHFCNDSTRP